MELIYSYIVLVIYLVLLIAYSYGKKTRAWKWSEYVLMTLGPLVGLFLFYLVDSWKAVAFFLGSCVIGFLGELIIGFLFEKTLGRKIWEHKKMSVRGHTSWLVIPFWGMAGLMFLALLRILGF